MGELWTNVQTWAPIVGAVSRLLDVWSAIRKLWPAKKQRERDAADAATRAEQAAALCEIAAYLRLAHERQVLAEEQEREHERERERAEQERLKQEEEREKAARERLADIWVGSPRLTASLMKPNRYF